jgi:GntR family transcriptional regulator
MNRDIFRNQRPSFGEDNYEGVPLVQRVSDQLKNMIMEGKLAPESQLPNEPDLSNLLNVSRSTIRSALTILEQAGFVQRRWGVGTFVAKNPPTYKYLNMNSGVTQLIRSSGAEPGSTESHIYLRPASEHLAKILAVEPESPLVVIERVRLANGRRVVFCIDHIPFSLFQSSKGNYSLEEIETYLSQEQSMYEFLHDKLSIDIHHGIAWFQPVTAESYLAEKLQIAHKSSILHVEQVDFGANGDPIALSDEYYVADAFVFSVYRSG